MLELQTSKGLRLGWLEEVFEQERRGRYGLNTERSWGTQQITVADRTQKSFFRSKTVAGGDALWVPYVPGDVNYGISRGMDVISGPFSGCIMAAYDSGRGRRVCHVSTAEEGHKDDAKGIWTSIKEHCVPFAEFKPFDAIGKLSKSKKKSLGNALFFGFITNDNRCYTLVVDRTNRVITAKATIRM